MSLSQNIVGHLAFMARWPDNAQSTLVTALLIFGLFPALCWLTWWFVRG